MRHRLAEEAIRKGNVKCVILAAGEGRRQSPATDENINRFANAKPLLPVAGRKIIDFPIDAARRLGLSEVRIAAGRHYVKFRKMLMSPERCSPQGKKDIRLIIHDGNEPRDTLGDALAPLLPLERKDTVIVLSGDIVSNIDLLPILEKHLEAHAAATAVALPVPWESDEWKERGFPILLTEDTPRMSGARSEFEAHLESYLNRAKGQVKRVTGFQEKVERKECPGNLSITSMYIFDAGFLMDLAPSLTPKHAKRPFSDFGFHVFPMLTGQYDNIPRDSLKAVIRKVDKGDYPFYAYIPTDAGIGGQPMFWHDTFGPMALWKINMMALAGLADSWLGIDGRYKPAESGWGFIGDSSYISPDVGIGNIPSRNYKQAGISIIGSKVTIGSKVKIGGSFIDDHTNLLPKTEVLNSVISLGLSRPTSYIGKTRLVNCLVLGEGFPPNFADIRMLRNALVFNVPYFDGFGIVPLLLKPNLP